MKTISTDGCKWHGLRQGEKRTHTFGVIAGDKSVLVISSGIEGPKIEAVSNVLSAAWRDGSYDEMMDVADVIEYGDDAVKSELKKFLVRCRPMAANGATVE